MSYTRKVDTKYLIRKTVFVGWLCWGLVNHLISNALLPIGRWIAWFGT